MGDNTVYQSFKEREQTAREKYETFHPNTKPSQKALDVILGNCSKLRFNRPYHEEIETLGMYYRTREISRMVSAMRGILDIYRSITQWIPNGFWVYLEEQGREKAEFVSNTFVDKFFWAGATEEQKYPLEKGDGVTLRFYCNYPAPAKTSSGIVHPVTMLIIIPAWDKVPEEYQEQVAQ